MNFFRRKVDHKGDLSGDVRSAAAEVSDSSSVSSKPASSVTAASESGKGKLIKCHVPFDKPIYPIKRQEFDLDEEQQRKYDQMLEHFKEYALKEHPVSDKPDAPTCLLTEEEKAWLTKECFLRYLRATKWKLDAAIKRMEDSIIWRRTFGLVALPEDVEKKTLITADLVEEENKSGKNLVVGYDIDNRPCLYLRNGYQNTNPSMRQVQHLVFMLERVIQFMPPGQDTLALLIDFKAAPAHMNLSSKFPSYSISKQVLHILQHHYPERLGRGLFTNIPWIGYTFFKIMGPFIDPYTRLKTIYDQPFENFVPKEQLDKEFNGNLDFEYIHDTYWKTMNEMAEEKHNLYLENFRKLGGAIGLSEFDLRFDPEIHQ